MESIQIVKRAIYSGKTVMWPPEYDTYLKLQHSFKIWKTIDLKTEFLVYSAAIDNF